MAKRYVKIDDRFIDSYITLNVHEFNFFCYILSKMQKVNKVGLLEISISEIIKNSIRTYTHSKKTKDKLKEANKVVFGVIDEKEMTLGNLFKGFIVKDGANYAVYEIDDNFIKWNNSLRSKYTRVCIDEIKNISSKIERCIYLKCRQFTTTHFVKMRLDNLKKLLKCEGYKKEKFIARLKEYTKELNNKVDFNITTTTEIKNGKVTHIIFKFSQLHPVKPTNSPQTAEKPRIPYKDYLQTSHWLETRKQALERAAHKCQLCSSPNNLNVHHNNYSCLYNETDKDLIVLCKNCHSKFHDKLA